jgi:predicted ABC-type ATPase
MPELYIIAGPNGAGKTTAAKTILPEVLKVREFVNADEIAKGLSPFNPEGVAIQAGKIMLQRMEQLINEKESFAIETTLSTISYLKTIALVKAIGYSVTLFYVWLDSPLLAIERVKRRVSQGGHNIPADVIERRYHKALTNLPKFLELVDSWYLYDNSESFYELIAKKITGKPIILNFEKYRQLMKYGNE